MSSRKDRWKLLAEFTDWLLDPYAEEELPEKFKKVLNHRLLISMLFKLPHANQFANKFLNNRNVYSIPINELAKFMKHLALMYGVRRKDIWWFSNLVYYDKYEKLKLSKPYEKNLITKLTKQGLAHDYVKEHKPVKIKNESSQNHSASTSMITQTPTQETSLKQQWQNYLINQKQSTEICKSCTLFQQPIVTIDTNMSETDQCDVLFVAEAPGEDEVKQGIPLIGKAGQRFRHYLNQYFGDLKWFITNTCLCRPPNNRTPTDDEIKYCADKLDVVIDTLKPKLIIALGTTAMKRLTGNESGITKLRGQFFKYETDKDTYDVMVTVHPSFLIRSGNSNDYMYEEDFVSGRNFLLSKQNEIKITSGKEINPKEILTTFPEEILKHYNLVNVYTYYSKESGNNVYFLLRHKQTGKLTRYSIPTSEFYYYELIDNEVTPYHVLDKKHVTKLTKQGKLRLVKGRINRDSKIVRYESDIRPESRFLIDYTYLQDELGYQNDYKPIVCYFDIEVYSDVFPDPDKAEYPVVLITAKYDLEGEIKNVCYILGDKKSLQKSIKDQDDEYLNIIKNYELKFFKKEENLLQAFIHDYHKYDVDILAAWNILFDIGYIYNRLKKLHVEPNILARFDDQTDIYIDQTKYLANIPGYVVLDLLSSYRFMVPGNRASYSLDYISKYEGIRSEGKKFKGAKFNKLWEESFAHAVAYNIEDVEIMYQIDQKMSIVNFLNEFRKLTATTWEGCKSTARFVDSLILLFAKKQGKILRDRIETNDPGQKVGAYVYPPKPGLHTFVFEADFKSLYPTLIQTINIGPDTLVAHLKNGLEDTVDYIAKKDKVYTVITNPLYNPTHLEMTYEELNDYIISNNLQLGFGGGIFYRHEVRESILVQVIAYLRERREFYKKKYKETGESIYDIFQYVYKIALNSIYGYLGFDGSRFKHSYLVNNVTLSGQILNKFCALSFVEYEKAKHRKE